MTWNKVFHRIVNPTRVSAARFDSSVTHHKKGPLAQLGERLICIQEVIGSIPIRSTNSFISRASMARPANNINFAPHGEDAGVAQG